MSYVTGQLWINCKAIFCVMPCRINDKSHLTTNGYENFMFGGLNESRDSIANLIKCLIVAEKYRTNKWRLKNHHTWNHIVSIVWWKFKSQIYPKKNFIDVWGIFKVEKANRQWNSTLVSFPTYIYIFSSLFLQSLNVSSIKKHFISFEWNQKKKCIAIGIFKIFFFFFYSSEYKVWKYGYLGEYYGFYWFFCTFHGNKNIVSGVSQY